MFRRRQPEPDPYDPALVGPSFRAAVTDALRARAQFEQIVSKAQPGPLHDRLDALRSRVATGVQAVWETARRGTELEQVIAGLEPERVTAQLKDARRGGADDETIAALQARFTSVNRLMDSLDAIRSRLPIVEARLGTAVARTAELVFASTAAGVDALQNDLDSVVVELEALARATAELGGA